MTRLAPIRLDDNTIIYIEANEDVVVPPIETADPSEHEEAPVTRGLPSVEDAQELAIQSFQAIEGTIRAYTTYSLNAFKNLASVNVDKVTLKFGVEIGGEAGIPYITKGNVKSNLNIEVECSFPKRSESPGIGEAPKN